MAWYSGWYNGLAHKHYMDYKKGRELEHLVIEYCKAHQDERIIHAIAREPAGHARRRDDAGEVRGVSMRNLLLSAALCVAAPIWLGDRGERPANRDLSVRGAGWTRVPVRRANRGLSNGFRVALWRAKGSARDHAARRQILRLRPGSGHARLQGAAVGPLVHGLLARRRHGAQLRE